MYFYIMDKGNKPVIGGKLVFLRPYNALSTELPCFCVYMHEVVLNDDKFELWKNIHLLSNNATGSGGIAATSEYDYIKFSMDIKSGDYDFIVTSNAHKL